jgi:N-acetyl sugar amidotransferase
VFDEDGICSGCRIHEEKNALDWNVRFKLLEKIVDDYRNKYDYDCIVPVSGGRDAFYILDICINQLGLKPLCVNYNHGYYTPEGLNNLANLKLTFNVDVYQLNPNPNNVKKLTRNTLNDFGSVYWHVLAGHSALPVQLAISKRIPLIIWGAHQGLEQVGMFSHEHAVEMTRRNRADHDLMGIEAADLVKPYNTISKDDLYNYVYPPFQDLIAGSVRGIYLGNYVRWDTFAQHRKMVKQYDYLGRRFSRTFYHYDNPDCYVYNGVHDILKLFKHGYTKARDQLVREIRFNRVTRNQAAHALVKYENSQDENLAKFAEWIGIKPSMLSLVLNKHRNPKIWTEIAPNEYERRDGTWSAKELAANIPLEEYGTSVDSKFDLGSVLDTSDYPDSYGLIATGVRAPKIEKSYKVEL